MNDQLHQQIVNLPLPAGWDCAGSEKLSGIEKLAYKVGHRDARHAAAELVAAFEPRTTITNDRAAAVDPDYYFREMDTCPRGVKCLLLTKGGVAVMGTWMPGDNDILGWAPLPKRRPA